MRVPKVSWRLTCWQKLGQKTKKSAWEGKLIFVKIYLKRLKHWLHLKSESEPLEQDSHQQNLSNFPLLYLDSEANDSVKKRTRVIVAVQTMGPKISKFPCLKVSQSNRQKTWPSSTHSCWGIQDCKSGRTENASYGYQFKIREKIAFGKPQCENLKV